MSRNNLINLISLNILFWIAVYLVGLGLGLRWDTPIFSTRAGNYAPTFFWGTVFNALIIYGNSFWLYPLKKRQKWKAIYWLIVLFLLILFSIIEAYGDGLIAEKMGLEEQLLKLRTVDGEVLPEWAIIIALAFGIFLSHIFFFFLSFLNVFYIDSLKGARIKQTLEKEKLKAELKFLKAQINPHFLFNGINSVYHLIDPKPEIAKSTLLNFSNLLRYQLYECNDDLIPLEKELIHIRDYVEMEKIRKGEDVVINLELPDEIDQIKIPPLLFTPFIENAFKYVSNYDEGQDNKINIKIRWQMDKGRLRFEATNTIDENTPKFGGGIGIENVKKRLSLLFPHQHDLDIFRADNRFIVRMSLGLQ